MDKLAFVLILIIKVIIGDAVTNRTIQIEDIPRIENVDTSLENDNTDVLYVDNEYTKDVTNDISKNITEDIIKDITESPTKENKVKYDITENNAENITFNFTNIVTSNINATTTERHEELKPFTNPKYLSILHIKIENEDKHQNVVPSESVDPFQVVKPNLNILNFLAENAMQYIDGVKKGVANGINSFGNINYQPYINRVVSLSNLAAAPVAVFNKLHRKTVDTASRIHDFFLAQNIRH